MRERPRTRIRGEMNCFMPFCVFFNPFELIAGAQSTLVPPWTISFPPRARSTATASLPSDPGEEAAAGAGAASQIPQTR